MLNNWQRLEQVIKWTGLSVNSFALNIGLKRSENLYQIKKGNNGISRDLAELISKKYPSISKGWLLSGEGTMFLNDRQTAPSGSVPFFSLDAVDAVQADSSQTDPRFMIFVPPFIDCNLAALCLGTAMQPEIPPGSIVVLKQTDLSALVPGETYLVRSEKFNGIRVVRQGQTPDQFSLVARNTSEYDPIVVEKEHIFGLYLVRGVIIQKNG